MGGVYRDKLTPHFLYVYTYSVLWRILWKGNANVLGNRYVTR